MVKKMISFSARLISHGLGWLYCLYLSRQYSARNLRQDFEDKHVFILGSGSSIDDIQLSLISESTIVLLNASYKKYIELEGRQNTLFWMCIDNDVFKQYSQLIPSDISKIISTHSFNFFRLFPAYFELSKIDTFLMPKAEFRRDSRCNNFYGILPKGLDNHQHYENHLDKYSIFVPDHTVMLTAVLLSELLNPKSITLMGFDLGGGYANNIKEKSPSPYEIPGYQKSREEIEKTLKLILASCNRKGIILCNNSPRTEEKVLPKTNLYLK